MFGWLKRNARGGVSTADIDRDLEAIGTEIDETRSAAARTLVSIDSLGRTVVATIVDGDLTADKVADLSHELKLILERHPETRNLVLDLQNVEYMDSTCLNMFVELLRTVQETGGSIALASAVQHVEVLFKLTRLDQLFPIKRSVMDAIAAVERDA
jgi:anti-anti-sigma factor